MRSKEDSPFEFRELAPKDKAVDDVAAFEKAAGSRVTVASLSLEQRKVFDSICAWFEGGAVGEPVLTVGGYAGTGKTRLLAALAGIYQEFDIAFAAFTGKAAGVLRKKFREANAAASTPQTLHSLMYYTVSDPHTGRILGTKLKPHLAYDLIVVDEASMVSEKLFQDLLSFNIPILAVGDHGQLPPVASGSFNLMKDPKLRLETIHRQAADSPILALSAFVRRTGSLPRMPPSLEVQVLPRSHVEDVIDSLYGHGMVEDVAFICATNARRVELNTMIRERRFGVTHEPLEGDQVICLRNTEGRLFNGMRGIVAKCDSMSNHHYNMRVELAEEGFEVRGPVSKHQFDRPNTFKDFAEYSEVGFNAQSWNAIGLLLDYGYAMTCHKAQGSQWDHVIVDMSEMPSRFTLDEKRRWVYTAITRAAKYLVVLT